MTAEGYAVIGMACRFPKAPDLDSFWRLMEERGDGISEVPPERLGVSAADAGTRWAGLVDGLDRFDPDFFGIPAVEARHMDPQQRMLLEVAYEALQHAGIPAASLRGSRTGVFAGAASFDHGANTVVPGTEANPYKTTGSALGIIANRLSYVLDLRGPSLTIDTACSSALVALAAGIESLRSGQSDLAVVGGVNVLLNPAMTASFAAGNFMASDGRCKPFDHRADGYVRSEGAGVVVVKRLADALADHDRVHAVVRGVGVNQDGRSNGIFAPNRYSQEELLRRVYAEAGIAPETVDYVEAHGTGTALGDPIEVSALAEVLAQGRTPGGELRIGSVKSNIGHLEAGAGIAGLIKVVLSLTHRRLPPVLHFEKPNPYLRLDRIAVTVQDTGEAWPEPQGRPRRAGVSSFGFGGTNAHAVLEEWVPPASATGPEPAGAEPRPHLLPVSAPTPELLRQTARRWADFLAGAEQTTPLENIAATAAHRRDHHRTRAAIVADTTEQAVQALTALSRGAPHPRLVGPPETGPGRKPQVVYLFPGNATLREGMEERLAAASPVFRRAWDEARAALAAAGGAEQEPGSAAARQSTDTDQGRLFAVQVALARMWQDWGIPPSGVVGHGVGEVAAAHVAGALTLADAARVATALGTLAHRLGDRGAVLVTDLDPEKVRLAAAEYGGRLGVTAYDTPRSTTVTGEAAAVRALAERIRALGGEAETVPAPAVHGPLAAPLLSGFIAQIGQITPTEGSVLLFSTVTTHAVAGTELTPQYWARTLKEPARLAETVRRLTTGTPTLALEVSPHPHLVGAVTDVLTTGTGAEHPAPPASGHRGEDEHTAVLRALATLYTAGADPRWPVTRELPPVPLPAHGWRHRQIPLAPARGTAPGTPAPAPLLGAATPYLPEPGTTLHPLGCLHREAPYLADHSVDGRPVVPGAVWISAAAEAAARSAQGPVELLDLDITELTGLPEREDQRPQLVLRGPGSDGTGEVLSADGNTPRRHLRYRYRTESRFDPVHVPEPPPADADVLDGAELYRRLAQRGLDYGPAFRGVLQVRSGGGLASGTLREPRAGDHADALLPPAVLDSCFHILEALVGDLPGLAVPVGLTRMLLRGGKAARIAECRVRLRSRQETAVTADLVLLDPDGAPVAAFEGLSARFVHRADRTAAQARHLAWQPFATATAQDRTVQVVLAEGEDPDGGEKLAAELVRAAAGRLTAAHGPSPHTATPAGPQTDVFVCPLPGPDADPADSAHRAAGAALSFLHTHLKETASGADRRAVVLALAPADRPSARIAAAAVAGAVRTAINEHPRGNIHLVEAEASSPVEAAAALASLLCAANPPRQARIRGGTVETPRLVDAALPPPDRGSTPIRADRAYLVTGGLGSLGLAVARWLVAQKAGAVILAGRRRPSGSTAEVLRELGAAATQVHTVQVDAAQAEAVSALLGRIGPESDGQVTPLPLGGVFHCAGVLADAVFTETTGEHLATALSGKVAGAWNLHTATAGHPLDLFVLFSSLAGVVGSPGQTAYAAANAALDAVARVRAELGLPAQSIAWGPWTIGLAGDHRSRLQAAGLHLWTPQDGMDFLTRAFRHASPSLVAAHVTEHAAAAIGPVAAELAAAPGTRSPGPSESRLREELQRLPNRERRLRRIQEEVRRLAGEALGTGAGDVPLHDSFQDLGLDSLLAVNLRNTLEEVFRLRLPTALLWSRPTVADLAEELLDRIQGRTDPPTAGVPRTAPAARPAPAGEPDPFALTDEELISELSRHLAEKES